ncbi:hypothetical protein JHJ32_16680 [Parapedobacter sp. ISTM3]|uniref:Outer membrane protein beta-barrel domain-containing protein n=1 Tax=Parapedobacter luteus TaxID=623280 RepID=A0A1T5EVP4_9SPHI|nr:MULTISPECIES: hypothetical protein [Parapedobacter]MBK1441637.1 hypothetical protein [Parapedobacter sp. ISTM3]SKB88034.1 hypothetical protein SAMN05660226_03618 [Parapedobacter luteus]
MKKKITLLIAGLIGLLSAHAQDQNPFNVIRENPAYQWSFGPLLSSAGLGLAIYRPLGNPFGVQLGVNLMPFDTQIIAHYGDHETRSKARARLHNAHLLFGWAPFYRAQNGFRHFTIQLGGGYFFQAKGTIHTELNENYSYGDIIVRPVDVGLMTTTVSWAKTVAPYAGIAFGNIRIDDRFSFNLTAGAYRLSSPRVDIVATELLQGNEANGPIIERNVRNYRYLPNIQFGLNYNFFIR